MWMKNTIQQQENLGFPAKLSLQRPPKSFYQQQLELTKVVLWYHWVGKHLSQSAVLTITGASRLHHVPFNQVWEKWQWQWRIVQYV